VEGARSDGVGSSGAWLRSGADDFGAKRERSHANMGRMMGKGEAGARIEVGAAPRAALVQRCKSAYGLCKGAKVRCMGRVGIVSRLR
jgi:hypothetical protein